MVSRTSIVTSGIFILFSYNLKITTAQFKVLDSSSFRARKSDTNVTFVQINPLISSSTIDDDTAVITTTFFEGGRPRGFISEKDVTTPNTVEVKIMMESPSTDDLSSLFRVGKLQENAASINRDLLEPERKIISHITDQNTPIIRIQTLNPLRLYRQTVPTKNPLEKQKIKNNFNEIRRPAVDSGTNSIKTKQNLKNSFRKFKSRCRCEKLTNCQKLQISIQRCPPDYFMCCF